MTDGAEATVGAGAQGAARHHHLSFGALTDARGHLQKRALKVVGYVVVAYLLMRLIPSFKQALQSVEHLSWQWMIVTLSLETVSELGFVTSWRAIVDQDNMLEREGRGHRLPSRVAWAQLGGGFVVPGGTYSGIGVGAWILHRLGMPLKQIAERQFTLSFLNTAVDALALIFFGLGLWLGIFSGKRDALLTLVPALVGILGLAMALLIARRAAPYAARLRVKHQKTATAIETLAQSVDDTDQLLFHRGKWQSVIGALVYLFFDVAVLYTAFHAIHAHPIPSFATVVMAYIIGALGGSLPLPAGVGAVGGIAGFLILYGVGRNAAIAAAVIYGAIGLIVPLVGGGIAYLFLRREFGAMPAAAAESVSTAA